mmetsp:Transcript_164/g.355  ORF Transcript_164/g.355 Transcript_164/m.355 type:complete len:248 (+) Transcript_164:1406-2149(+)
MWARVWTWMLYSSSATSTVVCCNSSAWPTSRAAASGVQKPCRSCCNCLRLTFRPGGRRCVWEGATSSRWTTTEHVQPSRWHAKQGGTAWMGWSTTLQLCGTSKKRWSCPSWPKKPCSSTAWLQRPGWLLATAFLCRRSTRLPSSSSPAPSSSAQPRLTPTPCAHTSMWRTKTLTRLSQATAKRLEWTSGITTPGTGWATSTTGRRSTSWPPTTSGGRSRSTTGALCCTAIWVWCCTQTGGTHRHWRC